MILLFAALGACAMRELRRPAVFADKEALFFHSQMRPTPADFSFGVMLERYASHGNLYVHCTFWLKKVNRWTVAAPNRRMAA